MRVVLVLTCGVLVSAAEAQIRREGEDVHVRNECRLAAQVLTTGEPAPHYRWALGYVIRCDESGPPALATLWGRLSDPDRDDLEFLSYNTSRLRDQRILEAVVTVAQDPGRHTLVRLAAFQVLVSYFDTGYVSIDALEAPPAVRVMPRMIDFVPSDGAEPLRSDAEETILAVMQDLAQGDPDPTVQRAAEFVARGLDVRRETRARKP